jgi:hypothetical protein
MRLKRLVVLTLLPLLMLAFVGCASSPELSLGYKYATIKLIENGTVQPADVIDRAERIRSYIEPGPADLLFGLFVDRVKAEVGYNSLQASDRILIDALLGDAQLDLDVVSSSILTDAHRLAINQRLDWIIQAASMSGG